MADHLKVMPRAAMIPPDDLRRPSRALARMSAIEASGCFGVGGRWLQSGAVGRLTSTPFRRPVEDAEPAVARRRRRRHSVAA